MVWFADFETNKFNDEAIVYLGYIENLDNNNGHYFLNIEELFNFLKNQKTKKTHTVYFHNLTWDGEFIIWWLINNGFLPEKLKVERSGFFREKTDWLGQRLEIYVNYKGTKIIFLDTYKLWPEKLEKIGHSLNFEKLKIEHKEGIKYNNLSEVSKDELEYVKRDVQIIKLKYIQYSKYYDIKKSASSSSWNNFKKWYVSEFDKKTFKYKYQISQFWFDYLKVGYFGGFNQINKNYLNIDLMGTFKIFDINSSYPSIISDYKIPYGEPKLTKPDGDYVEFIDAVICNIKKRDYKMVNHLHNWIKNKAFNDLYIENCNHSMNVLYLKEEWEELKLTYDFEILQQNSIYFKADNSLKKYIVDLYKLKENEDDKVLKKDHKRILNSLVGKFGQNYYFKTKYLRPANNADFRKFKYGDYVYDYFNEDAKEIKYIPIALFVTAMARVKLIKAIRANIDYFIYCDTDSIIFLDKKNNDYDNILLNQKKLGFWKIEDVAVRLKILKPKFYIYKNINNEIKRVLSGVNKDYHYLFNFDNFKIGNTIKNANLIKKKIKGGFILENKDVVI